ncbi:MAG: heme biosynthesis protein HemY [Rhizobiaceae bacterium]
MIRLLAFLAVVFLLGLGFAWLADRPGDMVVTFDGYQYQVSLMAAAALLTAVVAAVMVLWWMVKSIWTSPFAISRHFRARRRDRGYQALSTGMIAAGAGDFAKARQKNKEAGKLINADQEPLIHLLEAQTFLLEGNHDGAREKFEAMIDDPEMKLLGLRGLYLEAERLGDKAAARHYAARAADVAPQLGWASDSTLEERVEDGDWDGALKLLDAQKATRQFDKETLNRRRAVLLTAKALATFDTDQAGSRSAALEANRLAPSFAPAAIVAARALIRADDVRKASKLLEAAWKDEPHPEVADLYVHARPGDATHDRLARAQRLQSLRQNNVESSLIVARAALDAQEYKLARQEVEAAIRMQPREAGYLLRADIEEAETGDVGRIRQWLGRAVRAPRDPAWVADGHVAQHWAPISPVTGRLDAFEWKAPIEQIGALIEQDDPLVLPETPSLTVETADEPDDVETIEIEAVAEPKPPVAANDEKANGPPMDEERAPPPLPDDPGVDPDRAKQPSRRFKLF